MTPKHLFHLLPLLLSGLLLGCGSLQNGSGSFFDGLLYAAAGSATIEALNGHPERRAQLEQAATDLDTIAASTNGVSIVALNQVIQRLPFKELQSQQGKFLLLATGGLAYQGGVTTVPVPVAWTSPTARALSAGIRAGLGMQPK
jgi:hypothetical protein